MFPTTSIATWLASIVLINAARLPFTEEFDNSAQMTLSRAFDGAGTDYFGISNGNNSDFGDGTANPLQYQGE
jgi:hypothetical protein